LLGLVQTDENPVILVAEYAIRKIHQTFKLKLGFRPTKPKNELDSLFSKLEASIMTLKYSYLSLDKLSNHNEIKSLDRVANELLKTIQPAKKTPSTNKLAYSTIEWGIQILKGLANRLRISDSNLGTGIDIRVVRVRNVQKREKIVQTRAYDNQREYTIMTNLLEIKPNINLAAAFLPPVEVGGEISEAMYLGLEERTEEAGHILMPTEANLNEVNAFLHQYLKKK
jgi:predicted RNA-binding protein with EMAP domain